MWGSVSDTFTPSTILAPGGRGPSVHRQPGIFDSSILARRRPSPPSFENGGRDDFDSESGDEHNNSDVFDHSSPDQPRSYAWRQPSRQSPELERGPSISHKLRDESSVRLRNLEAQLASMRALEKSLQGNFGETGAGMSRYSGEPRYPFDEEDPLRDGDDDPFYVQKEHDSLRQKLERARQSVKMLDMVRNTQDMTLTSIGGLTETLPTQYRNPALTESYAAPVDRQQIDEFPTRRERRSEPREESRARRPSAAAARQRHTNPRAPREEQLEQKPVTQSPEIADGVVEMRVDGISSTVPVGSVLPRPRSAVEIAGAREGLTAEVRKGRALGRSINDPEATPTHLAPGGAGVLIQGSQIRPQVDSNDEGAWARPAPQRTVHTSVRNGWTGERAADEGEGVVDLHRPISAEGPPSRHSSAHDTEPVEESEDSTSQIVEKGPRPQAESPRRPETAEAEPASPPGPETAEAEPASPPASASRVTNKAAEEKGSAIDSYRGRKPRSYNWTPVATQAIRKMSLQPTLGPAKGGTEITVMGLRPGEDVQAELVFSTDLRRVPVRPCSVAARSAATGALLGDRGVRFRAPAWAGAGTVDVTVVLDGVDFHHVPLSFSYYPTPRVQSVVPARVNASESTRITLQGANLEVVDGAKQDRLWVRLKQWTDDPPLPPSSASFARGSAVNASGEHRPRTRSGRPSSGSAGPASRPAPHSPRGRVVQEVVAFPGTSSSSIVCDVGPVPALGLVRLEVTVDGGVTWTNDDVSLALFVSPDVRSVAPAAATAGRDASLVLTVANPQCLAHFDTTHSTIAAPPPPLVRVSGLPAATSDEATTTTTLTFEGSVDKAGAAVSFVLPASAVPTPCAVTLALSVDGGTSFCGRVPLTVFPAPVVSVTSPGVVTWSGGVRLDVTGSGFGGGARGLSVRFENPAGKTWVVRGAGVSDTLLRCKTPRFSPYHGFVTVAVAGDGCAFGQSGATRMVVHEALEVESTCSPGALSTKGREGLSLSVASETVAVLRGLLAPPPQEVSDKPAVTLCVRLRYLTAPEAPVIMPAEFPQPGHVVTCETPGRLPPGRVTLGVSCNGLEWAEGPTVMVVKGLARTRPVTAKTVVSEDAPTGQHPLFAPVLASVPGYYTAPPALPILPPSFTITGVRPAVASPDGGVRVSVAVDGMQEGQPLRLRLSLRSDPAGAATPFTPPCVCLVPARYVAARSCVEAVLPPFQATVGAVLAVSISEDNGPWVEGGKEVTVRVQRSRAYKKPSGPSWEERRQREDIKRQALREDRARALLKSSALPKCVAASQQRTAERKKEKDKAAAEAAAYAEAVAKVVPVGWVPDFDKAHAAFARQLQARQHEFKTEHDRVTAAVAAAQGGGVPGKHAERVALAALLLLKEVYSSLPCFADPERLAELGIAVSKRGEISQWDVLQALVLELQQKERHVRRLRLQKERKARLRLRAAASHPGSADEGEMSCDEGSGAEAGNNEVKVPGSSSREENDGAGVADANLGRDASGSGSGHEGSREGREGSGGGDGVRGGGSGPGSWGRRRGGSGGVVGEAAQAEQLDFDSLARSDLLRYQIKEPEVAVVMLEMREDRDDKEEFPSNLGKGGARQVKKILKGRDRGPAESASVEQWFPGGKGRVSHKGHYEGERLGDWRHGVGILVMPHGWVYEGDWSNDRMHGQGKLRQPNGSVYEGQFVRGSIVGQGVLKSPDGSEFRGTFVGGLPHGVGSKTWSDGSLYRGEMYRGEMHGQGFFRDADGREYEGNFHHGRASGSGRTRLPWGDSYTGMWANGKENGRGEFTWKDGRKYEGEWVDGKRSGRGTQTWPDGSSYVGEWKRGKQNGTGTYRSVPGAHAHTYTGEWRQGFPHGQGKGTLPGGGGVFSGSWVKGTAHGHGVLVLDNGRTVEGEWREGVLCLGGPGTEAALVVPALAQSATKEDESSEGQNQPDSNSVQFLG